ncbi:hypothetical protein BD289DRAFT_436492 [Coniella lustricola]|uniref:Uncharacterized protein n=1 Tax=Coniella lustricola TaxID=2025994 RepID=A0A2T3A591_9PEZI|nr:hypothetical protein BD289DRAFT_436492 [Coniella lustricola]
MLGRILLTFDSLNLLLGAWVMDFNSESHIFNPNWPPHAKFHCGQTITLSTALGFATLFLTWRSWFQPGTSKVVLQDSMKIAAFTGSIYWIAGLASILFPGSAGLDPEFGGPGFPQLPLFTVLATCALLGSWWESL